jgi:hypothetical protein
MLMDKQLVVEEHLIDMNIHYYNQMLKIHYNRLILVFLLLVWV